jgi:cytoskeletal protein CcmA (bactofilin family)
MSWMSSFSNLISSGTALTGDCSFVDSTRVEGSIEGEKIVVTKSGSNSGILYGDFILGKGGKCTVDELAANNVMIDGTLVCKELKAFKQLIIGENAVIKGGELLYEELTIHPGATLDGCKLQAMSLSSKSEKV